MTVLERKTVELDFDMRKNPTVDPNDPDPYVATIVKGECSLTNGYSGYFPINNGYVQVPSGLVAYVTFKVEMAEQRHKKVVIDLNGVEKPGSSDKG